MERKRRGRNNEPASLKRQCCALLGFQSLNFLHCQAIISHSHLDYEVTSIRINFCKHLGQFTMTSWNSIKKKYTLVLESNVLISVKLGAQEDFKAGVSRVIVSSKLCYAKQCMAFGLSDLHFQPTLKQFPSAVALKIQFLIFCSCEQFFQQRWILTVNFKAQSLSCEERQELRFEGAKMQERDF